MSVEVPHFSAQFSIGRDGAQVVEQDSPEDIAACVFRVAVCPIGFREDEPVFGVPELAWEAVPIDLSGWETAIRSWEPRAELETSEQAEAMKAAASHIPSTATYPEEGLFPSEDLFPGEDRVEAGSLTQALRKVGVEVT
jgi:hypothetical protein